MPEAALDPDLPIVDPHHHLWDLRAVAGSFPEPAHPFIAAIAGAAYYTFDQLHEEIVASGHNVRATVFMECGAFYNGAYGEDDKSVGEVEFVNGVAAQGASGLYGAFRPCTGIIGHADLRRGEAVRGTLELLQQAAPGRFRGIRHAAAWDADAEVLGPPFHSPEGLYRDTAFREGLAELGKLGLTFDAWLLEPQLDDVIDLARAFPDQPICLDHCGTPLGMASYAGRLDENFERWRKSIQTLAQCENVTVKLGGLAMSFCGMPTEGPAKGCGSEELAAMWKPYIDTCIAAFGPDRSMFESNYPVDRWGAEYGTLWNAFKRLTQDHSADERAALFADTAIRFYDLGKLPAIA